MYPNNFESTAAMVRERQQALLREAERERLIVSLGRGRRPRHGLTRRLAAWAGIQMIRWGSRLQAYSAGPTLERRCAMREM